MVTVRHRRPLGPAIHAAVAAVALVVPAAAIAQVRAFGEAEGFGRFATGARTNLPAASVYHVTNLNRTGVGSFRDAVSQPNRFVVFDVGGVIDLRRYVDGVATSDPLVVQDNITIAGQTAPGGITLFGQKVSYSGANNTITRYLGIRKGRTIRDDALSVANGTNMMFDHTSVAWGVDETFSLNTSSGQLIDNISIQSSIVGQGLDVVNHSAGGLMTIGDGRLSVLRSLFIDNETRNPKVRANNQFVNNVVYNWTTAAYIMGDTSATSNANVEGNYFIKGPSGGGNPFTSGTPSFHIYARDNWLDADKDGVLDGALLDNTAYAGADVIANPHDFPQLGMDSAQRAYQRVVDGVGPSLHRDAVDARMIEELTSLGTKGQIVFQESDLFPGYPGTVPPGPPRPTDTDNDGMPDAWESANGLNPNDAADWRTLNVDGYTKLEEYFNGLVSSHADRVWSAASGTWPTAGNWAGGAPVWDDDAFVRGDGAGASGNVTISTPGAQAMTLSVGGNGAAAGESVTVNSGGSLFVVDTLRLGDQNRGTMTLNSGGSAEIAAVVLGNATGAHVGQLNVVGGKLKTARIVSATPGSGITLSGGGTLIGAGTFQFAAPIMLATGGGTLDSGGHDGSVTGVISGAASLTKAGAGTLTLAAANTYTGVTRISGGTLAVSALSNAGAPGNLGASGVDPANLVLDGGALRVLTTSATDRGLTVSQRGGTLAAGTTNFTLNGDIVSTGSGSRTLSFDLGGASNNTSSVVGGIGENGSRTNVTKLGTGRLIFSGTPKTYLGVTTISAGTLLAYSTGVMPWGAGKGNVNVAAGATFDVRFHQNINGLDGAGTLTNNDGNNTRTLTLGNANTSGNFTGVAGARLNLVKVGSGTQSLGSLVNTYGGTTTVSGGVLAVGALANGGVASPIGNSSNAAANLVLDGGTLRATGSTDRLFTLGASGGTLDSGAGDLSFVGPGQVALTPGGNRTLTLIGSGLNSRFNLGLADPAGGIATLAKGGTGRLFLEPAAGAHTYSGDTTISGGTLVLAGVDVLPSGPGRGNVVITTGSTLSLGNNSQVINGLNGVGGSILEQGGAGVRTFTLGSGDANGNFIGNFGGSPSLTVVKAGSGTQWLVGPNIWGNGTQVDGGTLIVGTLRGNGPMRVNGGTLRIAQKSLGSNGGTSVVPSLTVDASDAALDLTDNAFIIDYAEGSLSPLQQVRSLLAEGRATGRGIIDSTAPADRRLGYADNARLGVTSFGGVSVDASSVLIRETLNGDANLDGSVNFSDLVLLAQSYNSAGPWTSGDFNYDGTVNFADLVSLAQNYNRSTSAAEPTSSLSASFQSDWALAQSLVPEPSTLSSLVIAGLLGVRRR